MEIPVPQNTGSSGTQLPAEANLPVPEPSNPLAGLPLAQRVEGLAATHPRNLGGEVAATLIAGSFTQLADDLRQQREQNAHANTRIATLQNELTESQTSRAVLQERLAAIERSQSIKQLSVFSGTALLAVAIDLYKGSVVPAAIIVALLGVALLIFGWVTRLGGPTK